MSNFAYVRPLGVWNTLTDLHAAEMAQLDQNLFKAPNFADGGTYAPSGVVTVGGAGMTVVLVGGNFVEGGSFTVASGASFGVSAGCTAAFGGTNTFLNTSVTNWATGSATNWQGTATATFQSGTTLTIAAGAEVQMSGSLFCHPGGFVEVDCAAAFSAAFSVANTGSFDVGCLGTFDAGITVTAGNVAILGGVTSLAGTNHIVGPTTISGPTSVTTAVGLTGAGRTFRQAVVGAASGGGTADPAVATTYYFPSVTADQVYTIVNTSAQDGDELEFWTESTTNSVSVHDHLGASIQAIKNAAGNFCWIKVKRILGNWKLVGITKL